MPRKILFISILSVLSNHTTSRATDANIPFSPGVTKISDKVASTAAGFATRSPFIAAPVTVAASIPSAINETATNHQPFGQNVARQVGRNVAIGFGGEIGAAAALGRSPVSTFVTKSAAKAVAENTYDNFFERAANSQYATIGGLQAKLSDTPNLTGKVNGIQQYNLLDDKFTDRAKAPATTRKKNVDTRSQRARPGPNDEMIGRVPGNNSFLDDAINGFTRGSRSENGDCRGIDYASQNPKSCYYNY